ncbi:MAG TPA: undecaprenyl-phosphate glucose phosphotransferase [Alphaproteobacteria bacterium]
MAPNRVAAADLEAWVSGALRIADVAIVVVAAVISYWIRHDTYVLPNLYIMAILAAVALTANYMQIARVYEFDNLMRLTAQIGLVAMSWTAVMLSLIALAYFTQTSIAFSRAFALGWFALTLGGLVLARILVLTQMERWRRAGRLTLNVAIIGAGPLARQVLQHLKAQGEKQYRIVGVFDDRVNDASEIEGYAFRGTVDDLVRYVRMYPIDEIVVAVPWQEREYIQTIVKRLKVVPTNVKLCPDYVGWTLPVRRFLPLAGVPMLAVLERPLSGWSLVIKALEDRILAVLLLVLFAPVLLVVALAIRLDSPGPVLFRQKRYGFNNNPITVYKFRTMHVSAGEDPAVPQARRNDPRVTRVGAFLRRTSLDELPQLLNVIKGEMSLVGPRPHAVAHNEQYATIIDDYLSRHRVKPGITGWAQVNGLRGETDTPEKMARRVQYDLYYIDNWSLLFDIKILLLTPFLGFVNKNAY